MHKGRKTRVTLVSFNIKNNYALSLYYLKLYSMQDDDLNSFVRFKVMEDMVRHSSKYLALKILLTNPDIVGFSCNIWNVRKTLKVARIIKLLRPGTTVVLGGQEVSNSNIDYMTLYPPIDIIVDGEGEEVFRRILRSYVFEGFNNLRQIPGISFRKEGRIVINPPVRLIADLDNIPSPYLHDEITIPPSNHLGMMIETSRGCHFRCSFCFEGNKYKDVRHFSMERVEREIEYMVKKNVRHFHILDPILGNADMDRLKAIHDIIERHVVPTGNYNLSVEVYSELLNEKNIRLLEHFTMFDIGLQSIIPDTLHNIRRGFNKERFIGGIKLLKRLARQNNVYLIMGLPGDDFYTFLRSVRFSVLLDVERLFINHLCVLNGTQLRTDALKHKLRFLKSPPYLTLSNATYSEHEVMMSYIFSKTITKEHDAIVKKSQAEVCLR